MEFKDRLKNLRQQNDISQEALAKEIFVSRSAIAKWENGLGIPSDINLQELCKFFDVKEDWLLDRDDLKKQIKITKQEIPSLLIAAFSLITPLIYVLLGFCWTFKEHIWLSMYYPPLSLFDFIVNYIDEPYYGLRYLLWCSVAVWAATVTFSVITFSFSKLRQRASICFCINFAFIIVSLSLFLILFFLTIHVPHSIYDFVGF